MQLSKAALARHLIEPHEKGRIITPLSELRHWRRDELESAHRSLGSCGLSDLAQTS